MALTSDGQLSVPVAGESAEDERAKHEAANGGCRLIKLPPELRSRTYHYAVTTGRLYGYKYGGREGLDYRAGGMGVIQICRALRTDTLPIFYGANEFIFRMFSPKQYKTGLRWFQQLHDEAIASIRSIMISLDVVSKKGGTIERGRYFSVEVKIDLEAGDKTFKVTVQPGFSVTDVEEEEVRESIYDYLKTMKMSRNNSALTKDGMVGLFRLLASMAKIDETT